MNEVSREQKISFLMDLFPCRSYSISEIAAFLHCSQDTVIRWLRHYEIPRIKITGSPFLLQKNLIGFLLQADDDHVNEEDIGLNFCISDAEKKFGKSPQMAVNRGRKP